jgi:hypothetical protein
MSLLGYYLTLDVTQGVSVLNVELLSTFPAGSYFGLTAHEGILYATDRTNAKVQRYNISTNTLLSAFTVTATPNWAGVMNGELIVTSNANPAPAYVYNKDTGASIRTFGSLIASYGGVYWGNEYFMVDLSGASGVGQLKVYNGAGTNTGNYNVGLNQALWISYYNNMIYLMRSDGKLYTFNPATKAFTGGVRDMTQRGSHHWTPGGKLLFGQDTVQQTEGNLRLHEPDMTLLDRKQPNEVLKGIAQYNDIMYVLSNAGKLYRLEGL